MNQLISEKAKEIRALVLDVDGVFTDGTFYLAPNGDELKCFHTQDGVGLKQLQKIGIIIAIITGRKSETVSHRMRELGIDHIYQGIKNKMEAYTQFATAQNLKDSQIAYMGDDLPDLPLIECVGLGIAPANAVAAVKAKATWVTQRRGGDAAIREVCDFIVASHDD